MFKNWFFKKNFLHLDLWRTRKTFYFNESKSGICILLENFLRSSLFYCKNDPIKINKLWKLALIELVIKNYSTLSWSWSWSWSHDGFGNQIIFIWLFERNLKNPKFKNNIFKSIFSNAVARRRYSFPEWRINDEMLKIYWAIKQIKFLTKIKNVF